MRLLLIHTGGTIGMVKTDAGFAPGAGVVEDALARLITAGEVPTDITIRTLEPGIDSAQATPADWMRIAACIVEEGEEFDAVVVTHGTDTLAHTAAALCLALPGLARPVVVTGAMLPLTEPGSDGERNLRDALQIAEQGPAGVWVQFAGKLLHGGRVRKSHSSAFDAFEADESPLPPILQADAPGLNTLSAQKVGVFTVTPGACWDVLAYIVSHCDGLVLRCYGSGTAPDTPEICAALAKARDRGVPVIAVSQCPEGGMKLGTYAAGQAMRETGVIDGRDTTPEMALVKMHFALSLHSDYAAQCAFLGQNLVGERSS
ncbi:asparaginase [Gymnodinialimonas ceratoperidinii]|uniref:Asparaginase n=1 Tax=Gymnodinialimonas ceratoperidinii TaxID=2856823 RepID=A0A8F6Y9R0_9RHOB|nr:asparaginase [Gymnodinialimonas ceratoperidinii]QXT38151.1 asparaginase [Gymnodinialimonas ceratoperidinii]